MATQTYMTAKLNLADGTIVYPQISLDNIVKSISDPTLVAVAQLDANSKVSISNLPVTTSVTNSNSTVPTNGAVYGALNTKQATLVEGDNIIHIINGSTIMADITNLDVAGIDQTATNGVHLVLDGNTVSAAAELAGATAGVPGTVMGATNGVTLDGGVVTGVFGDGVEVVGNTAKVDIATVAETLNGTAGSNMVDADGLKGAMSLGQAVDVSCQPVPPTYQANYMNQISIDGGTTWVDSSTEDYAKVGLPLGTFRIRRTGNPAAMASFAFGWQSNDFPKYATGLKYLFILDCKNLSSSSTKVNALISAGALVGPVYDIPSNGYARVALVTTTARGHFAFQTVSAVSSFDVEIKNWRQYEVTNLTDEAIQYLASAVTNPDPDKLFRSQDFFDVSSGYMIKSDMVNPWTYLIGMPLNSPAMTVAAGLAYQLQLTDGAEHEITVDTFPTNAYGADSHVQLLLGNNSTVVFKSPLNLIDALVPNAANNITIKFRAGQANVYLDDTDAGYVITVTSGEEEGSLYYGLMVSDSEYLICHQNTDGQVLELIDGVTCSKTFNLVGNGADKTSVSNFPKAMTKTATRAIAGVNIQGIKITGFTQQGCLDIYSPGGASGVEHIYFSNCVFDESPDGIFTTTGRYVYFTNCSITSTGPHFTVAGVVATNCVFNRAPFSYANADSEKRFTNCVFASGSPAWSIVPQVGYHIFITGCTIGANDRINLIGNKGSKNPTTYTVFFGMNKWDSYEMRDRSDRPGTYTSTLFAADSVTDLTGNTNACVICFANRDTAEIIGTTIGVVASEDAVDTFSGTATVLYSSALDGELDSNNEPFAKSCTISGGGAGYIMRNNGAIGVPVTTTSLGEAGSLDTLMNNADVSQITFAPVLDDGSTISLSGYSMSRYFTLNGPGYADGKVALHIRAVDQYASNLTGRVYINNLHFVDSQFGSNNGSKSPMYFVRNCRFTYTSAGGTVFGSNCKVRVYDCVVDGTGSPFAGFNGGDNEFYNCKFTQSSTTGAALRVQGGNHIRDCYFGPGGLSILVGNINTTYNSPQIRRCTFDVTPSSDAISTGEYPNNYNGGATLIDSTVNSGNIRVRGMATVTGLALLGTNTVKTKIYSGSDSAIYKVVFNDFTDDDGTVRHSVLSGTSASHCVITGYTNGSTVLPIEIHGRAETDDNSGLGRWVEMNYVDILGATATNNGFACGKFTNCTFTNCAQSGQNGAFFSTQYKGTFDGITFENCTFTNITGSLGVLLYSIAGTSSMKNCTITNTTAVMVHNGYFNVSGTCKIGSVVPGDPNTSTGTVRIADGSTIYIYNTWQIGNNGHIEIGKYSGTTWTPGGTITVKKWDGTGTVTITGTTGTYIKIQDGAIVHDIAAS